MSTIIIDQNNKTSNTTVYLSPYGSSQVAAGFTGNGAKVTQIKIKAPSFDNTGISVCVAIHSYDGTWPNGVPGAQLAQSEIIAAYELSEDNEGFVEFNFTGSNQLQTTNGSRYFVVFSEPDNSITTNTGVQCNGGSTVGSNGGNTLLYQGDWYNYEDVNFVFQVLGTSGGYSVTYNGNGNTGGSVPTDSNSYVMGASVTVKANSGGLVKTDHNFVGWATTSGASVPSFAVTGSNVNPPNFNMPASNVILYAVWQAVSATVFYDGNGQTSGSAPTDSNNSYVGGATVTVLGNTGNLVKTDHTFLGWSTNSSAQFADYTQGSTFTINQNTTLYAVWQPNGGGGGGFDGGTINNPIEIKCKFPYFANRDAVSDWMDNAPANPSDYSAYLRFTNINLPTLSTDMYGVAFKDESNSNAAAIGVNDNFFIRKKIYAKHGSIGELSIPSNLKVDFIESFTGQAITLKGKTVLKNIIDQNHRPSQQDLVRKIWGFQNGKWAPEGFNDNERCKSWILFTDADPPTSESGLNLFRIHTEGGSPLLAVDRGMIVQKDFTAGGFIAANQGALYLGGGLHTQIDIPKIILRYAYVPRIGDANYNNIGARPIPKGTQPPTDPWHYQLYIRTDAWNGNPPNTLYKWNDDDSQNKYWESLGLASDYGAYDTLYIRQMLQNIKGDLYDETPGHLDVGNVTVHGHLEMRDTDGLGLSRTSNYLICTTPNSSGGFSVDGYLATQKVVNANPGPNVTVGPLYRSPDGRLCVIASSERFKDNISVVEDCSWLYDLCPVSFDWKDKERAEVEGKQLGLVAEEVYQQCPQLTWLDVEGKPEGVHYEWLGVPLLVEIKKLRREVDELKVQLVALKKGTDVLEGGGE